MLETTGGPELDVPKTGKNYSQQKLVLLEEGCDLSPVESSCVVPYDEVKLNGPWMMCLHGKIHSRKRSSK